MKSIDSINNLCDLKKGANKVSIGRISRLFIVESLGVLFDPTKKLVECYTKTNSTKTRFLGKRSQINSVRETLWISGSCGEKDYFIKKREEATEKINRKVIEKKKQVKSQKSNEKLKHKI